MNRNEFLTGNKQMDLLHEDFYELLKRLRQATGESATHALADLIAHCRDHFGQEDRWMLGTQYKIGDCHIKVSARSSHP